MTTQEMLHAAQGAKMPLALADADTKNAALEAMAAALGSDVPFFIRGGTQLAEGRG